MSFLSSADQAQARVPAWDPGAQAAEAFRVFDSGAGPTELVIVYEVEPTVAMELHEAWKTAKAADREADQLREALDTLRHLEKHDWTCADGRLSRAESGGSDTCGGDADAPTLTLHACEDGRSCVAELRAGHDGCEASRRGTCAAVDWACIDGLLSRRETDGVDTCGDGSDAQLGWFVCEARDGAIDDTCASVPDDGPPFVSCPERVVMDCAGAEGAHVSGLVATAGDLCDDDVSVTNSYNHGGADASDDYPVGATEVVFTGRDDAGYEASCATAVEVRWSPWSFAVYAAQRMGVKLDHHSLVEGDVYSGDELEMKHAARIEGDALCLGDASFQLDAGVDGGLYIDGRARGRGSWSAAGPVPSTAPAPPVLDTTAYDGLIAQAEASGSGNVRAATLDLGGSTLLVDGHFELKTHGTLSGPGTIVASPSVRIGNGAVVGEDVALIAGTSLHVDKSATIADGALLAQLTEVDRHALVDIDREGVHVLRPRLRPADAAVASWSPGSQDSPSAVQQPSGQLSDVHEHYP